MSWAADPAQRRPVRRGVLQQLDRFVGEGVDRRACRLEQDVHRAGRGFRLIPFGRRRRQRTDDEDDDPLRIVEGRFHAGLVQCLEDLQSIEHGAHPDVVRNPAVDEMEIGPMDAIAEGLLGPGPLSLPQLDGLNVREMISPCTSRIRKRCS